jgi:AbiV family abortive infection protein
MLRKTERPEPGKQLFESLFVGRRPEATLQAISQGLILLLENAIRLKEDANILLKANRFASPKFLITTADEEIAKFYILLDVCRLDFSRHTSVLQRLCRSFYNHIHKYAYNQILLRLPAVHDMAQIKELWNVATTEWWPSTDYESGEPDMPHNIYFSRAMPLYVDFGDYDQRWYEPKKEAAFGYKFDDKYRLSDTQEAITKESIIN